MNERARAFKRNCARNLSAIRKFGGLGRVVTTIAGRHAVVIGAGPSLDASLSGLQACAGNPEICLIAADMALLPLRAAGVRPDFVISCESTPTPYFRGILTGDLHLLAFSCISPHNLAQWEGDISFYNWMIKGDMYEELWRTAGEDLGFVATGSVVLSQAVSIVLGCAVKSLLLVGNDLAYGKSYYAHGTRAAERFVRTSTRILPPESAEFGVIRANRAFAITRQGAVYHTNNQFLSARYWFEELFKSASVPIYDSSVPGVSPSAARKLKCGEYLELIGVIGGR